MLKLLTTVYGILTTIALALGLVVALVFLAALIAGDGDWAILAGDIMIWGIVLAAIALAGGMIYIYATGSHSLMMESPSKKREKEQD